MVRSHTLIAALFGAFLFFSTGSDAYAQTAQVDEDDDFDFLKQGEEAAKKKTEGTDPKANDFNAYDGDEEDLSNFKLAAPAPVETKTDTKKSNAQVGTNRATKLPYDMVGKTALADNYPAEVVFVDRDAVVIELPVLLARTGAEYDGRGYWIVAEVYADGMKITETRQQVSRPAVATQGPTMAFIKVLTPVPAATGTLEIRVGKATAVGGAATPLFKQTVSYNTNG